MRNRFHSPAETRSSEFLDVGSKSDAVCTALQEIGLPAVRIASGTAEVLNFNELFSSLINTAALPDYRLWFVEGIVRRFDSGNRTHWETGFSNLIPVHIHVRLNPPDRPPVDSIMRVIPSTNQAPADRSVVCVFMLLVGSYFDHLRQTWMAEGQELERNRIRAALHQGAAQQFLGAAFGCKVMADKISNLDEELANQASDLANLLSRATQELQAVVNPGMTNDR
jgi:hypothetical protein